MTNSANPDQLASSEQTDLDLNCLLRQGMSCSAREGLMVQAILVLMFHCNQWRKLTLMKTLLKYLKI